LKTGVGLPTVGSNPTPSAKATTLFAILDSHEVVRNAENLVFYETRFSALRHLR
jgi:hypothetical protein